MFRNSVFVAVGQHYAMRGKEAGVKTCFINKLFPNKQNNYAELFFLSCTIKMHAVEG